MKVISQEVVKIIDARQDAKARRAKTEVRSGLPRGGAPKWGGHRGSG
jgi:hypothetical protein